MFELLIFFGVAWFLHSFYWTRVLTVVLLMAIWGAIAVLAPAALALRSVAMGEHIAAVMQVGLAALSGMLWWGTFGFVKSWYVKQRDLFGGFWQPWDKR